MIASRATPAQPAAPLPAGCGLRRATADDLPAIRALVRGSRLDPTQLRWPQFLVVECAGQIAACGQLRRFPGAQELGSLVVAQGRRGQGLAAALIRRLIAEATRPLYLECEAPLAALYRRFGFARVSWRTVPGPLRLKFGLSYGLSRVLGQRVAAMAYRGRPA
jgi:amino-acid N-acetyltransferase